MTETVEVKVRKTKPELFCPRFNGCEASLCPLGRNLGAQIWFPDEPVCQAARFHNTGWVKRQRQIVKVGAPPDRYFTVEMLKVVRRVGKGIDGLDPDRPLDEARKAERAWIMAHQKSRYSKAKTTDYTPSSIAVKKSLG